MKGAGSNGLTPLCAEAIIPALVLFTNTVAVIELPTQLFAVGIIVKVTVTGALVVFVKVPLISPDALAAIPVTVPVLLRVQV
jgi:hypothetical protein